MLSILHRITGVVMVLLLPLLIYLLDRSLQGAAAFARVSEMLTSIPARLVLIVLTWVLAHHLLAGIRFLLLDIDLGVTRAVARRSAWLTHGLAMLATIIAAGVLL